MAFEQAVAFKVNEDGQFTIDLTDTWGTKRHTIGRRESREKAEALIKAQAGQEMPLGVADVLDRLEAWTRDPNANEGMAAVRGWIAAERSRAVPRA